MPVPAPMQPHACRRTEWASLRTQTASGVPSAPATCAQASHVRSVRHARSRARHAAKRLPAGVSVTHWASRTSHVGETESFQTSGELWSDALREGCADAAIGPCSLHTPSARRRWCEKAVQSACASHAAEHHGSVTCAIASGRCKEVPSNEAANPRRCGQRQPLIYHQCTDVVLLYHQCICPTVPPMHLSYCTTNAYPLTITPVHTARGPHCTTP